MFAAQKAIEEMVSKSLKDDERLEAHLKEMVQDWEEKHIKPNRWVYGAARPTLVLRAAFEFCAPILIALAALAVLWFRR